MTAPDIRRLHPLTPLFELLVLARQFAVPLVVAVLANRDSGQLFLLVPALLGTAAGAVKWWRFTYAIDGPNFVISEGVFTKSQRVIPIDRIQQVDVVTRLRHRLVGVTVLEIETAGGTGGPEATLSVVSGPEAERLRGLLRGAAPPVVKPEQDEPEALLLRLGAARLALAGVTGAELAIMFTILFWVGQLIDDIPGSFLEERVSDLTAPDDVAGFVTAGLVLVVFWFGLAAVASIFSDGRFRLVRRGDELRASRGLVDLREATVPLARVQAIRLQQSFVRRLLGMDSVHIRSTAGAIAVPLVTPAERRALLDAVLPTSPPEAVIAAPPAARRRAILRRVVPALVLAAPLAAWVPPAVAAAAIVVGAAAAAAAGELAYRGLAHAWGAGAIVTRRGGIHRETHVVPAGKVQSSRLRTTPFQRRAGLATLFVDVAGRGSMPAIRDGDAALLSELQPQILSSAARQDEAMVRSLGGAEVRAND